MTRRRYRQLPDLSLVEISDDDCGSVDTRRTDAALWSDRHYENLSTTDGVDISSRTKHRQYMKANGLTTFDDYKGEFQKREAERQAYRSGERGTVNRRDIERAIHKLMER